MLLSKPWEDEALGRQRRQGSHSQRRQLGVWQVTPPLLPHPLRNSDAESAALNAAQVSVAAEVIRRGQCAPPGGLTVTLLAANIMLTSRC